MKLFVSAYACEPGLGSEIGVGWHWVLELSRSFELWVLTRESNRHTIEPWIATHPEYSHIHWLYYDLPRWARWWKKGLRGVRTYYNLWQLCTNRIVRETMQANDIHLFHHLTYGNALWRVSRYGQQQTFIWGPIGGLETIPADYTCHYGMRWRMIEMVRRCAVGLLLFNLAYRHRCRNASLIFCKTRDTMLRIPEPYRYKARLMTDVAADDAMIVSTQSQSSDQETVSYLMVGRLDAWRGFDLAIEAFAQLAEQHPEATLTILGRGSDKQRLQRLIKQQGCRDRIVLRGEVSHDEYIRLMQNCDVVVNPALKEGAVTVVFDAISNGKPLACIETGGYTSALTPQMSAIVPLTHRNNVVDGLLQGMMRFADKSERENAKAEAARIMPSLTWAEKGKTIRDAILEVAK